MTLVEKAIERGWIKQPNNQVVKYSHLEAMRRRRAGFRARGLTGEGRPRKYNIHPELHGLPRESYRRSYYAKLNT